MKEPGGPDTDQALQPHDVNAKGGDPFNQEERPSLQNQHKGSSTSVSGGDKPSMPLTEVTEDVILDDEKHSAGTQPRYSDHVSGEPLNKEVDIDMISSDKDKDKNRSGSSTPKPIRLHRESDDESSLSPSSGNSRVRESTMNPSALDNDHLVSDNLRHIEYNMVGSGCERNYM